MFQHAYDRIDRIYGSCGNQCSSLAARVGEHNLDKREAGIPRVVDELLEGL